MAQRWQSVLAPRLVRSSNEPRMTEEPLCMRSRAHFRVISVLLVALALAAAARGQSPARDKVKAPHVAVSLLVPPAEIYPGENFTAGLQFQMEPGWHVYWTNAGDSGEPPAIDWKLPQGITAAAMQFPAPKRLPLGPLMDFGYDGQVVFPVPMQVAADFRPAAKQTEIAGHVTWLVCREVCIPGKADLALRRATAAGKPQNPQVDTTSQALIAASEAKLPKPLPASDSANFKATAKGFVLDVKTGSQQSGAEFFPLDETVITNAAPQPAKPMPHGVELTLTKDENLQGAPQVLNGVVELADGSAFVIHAKPGASSESTSVAVATGSAGAIGRAAGLAFIGGILLNLMPCVFPVLFIKGLALVQSSQQERRQLRAHGWVYTLGILVSFWAVVAVLLALRAAGRQLGWGFQFQSPVFLAVMAMLLFFLGLALAGQFEIGLSLTSAGGSLAAKHGYAGSFFTGVLAMVVATPCTAPFMGAAIGYALAHSALVSFAVFTALGLGLAVPYLALAYQPAWTRLLPKPGGWMELLKQAVSVPIFATVIWLVWVFTQIAGTNALIGLLAAFLLLAIAGWLLGRWPGRTGAATIAVVVVAAAVAVPVWAVRNLSATKPATEANSAGGWQPYSPDLVSQLRSRGKPVFVDFTAAWCLSCQVNERVILNSAAVQQHLRDSGVALVRADWTNQDAEITQALAALGRSGVPTYAIYPADPNAPPHVLPEVLSQGIVIDALNSLGNTPRQSASLTRPTSK
jgi:thiol:disulfide interchange protein